MQDSENIQTNCISTNPIPHLVKGCFPDSNDGFYRRDVLLVCHQHILASTRFLFEYLIEFICSGENIFLLGKIYSTIPSSASALKELGINFIENEADYKFGMYHQSVEKDVSSLWEAAYAKYRQGSFKKIILLDEGGFLAKSIPKSLKHMAISIEQTSYGIFNRHHSLPVINIAQSQTKKMLETPGIASAIYHRLEIEDELRSVSSIGIVGTGVIGTEVAELLQSKGYKILCFDIDRTTSKVVSGKLESTNSLEKLIETSDIIVGCSGRPSIPATTLKNANLILVSASSGDIEFSELLLKKQGKRQTALEPVDFQDEFSGVRILNGGFPYNFNKESELENLEDIIITRSLMVLGILQSLYYSPTSSGIYPLDTSAQEKLIANWLTWQRENFAYA